jgi:hypothetical protein
VNPKSEFLKTVHKLAGEWERKGWLHKFRISTGTRCG